MKTLPNIKIVFYLLSLTTTSVYARVSKEYVQWSKGEFEVPAEIKRVTNTTELQPFLNNTRDFVRMAAVRRVGEIEGSKAIGLLRELYAKEPPTRGIHAVPLVKLEIIRTLGKIGTDQAKYALLDILKNLWKKGPVLPERRKKKGYFYRDRDFAPVMPLLLETLYKWNSDKDVLEAAKTIAHSEDVKNFYRGRDSIGQRAWEVYLKAEITNKGVTEEKDCAISMLDFIEEIGTLHIDPKGLGPLKAAAACAILERFSEASLSSLVSEFEVQLTKEPDDPKGSLTERDNILRRKIGTLKKILKEKKEKEQKKAKMQEEKPTLK